MDGEIDRYRSLFEHANDAIALVEFEDPTPIIEDANPKFREVFVPEGESAIGRDLDELVAPSDQTEAAREVTRRVQAGELVREELTRETVDGPREFYWQVIPAGDTDLDSADRAFAVYTDITDRIEQERELEESEERYRRLLATAPTPILIYSADADIIYANEAAVEFLGAEDHDEVVGLSSSELIAPDSQEAHEARSKRLFEDREAVPPVEQTLLDLEGKRKQVVVASAPVTYEGEPAVQSIATDITELKAREQQLQRYETLVEVSGDPMYMLDESGCFTYVNEAMLEMTGHGRAAMLGEHVSVVMQEQDIERGEELISGLLSQEKDQGTFELELETADGDLIPVENHMSLLYEDGEFEGTVGVLRDITNRLERERRLQRERDRLDEFASVVSHDLRNPLNVAAGRLDMVANECESQHVEAVQHAIERMETLIDDMLSLARAGETVGETEPIDLAELVESCWRNVETDSAELVADTERTIRADRTRLQQLLENLFRNAVEHGGETVRITVGDLPRGFFVEDDGPGIPAEQREQVLEPGYSMAGSGTGFGLSIVRDIADAHDWSFAVTEGEDGGARFEFTGVRSA